MNIQARKKGLIEHEASDTGGVPRWKKSSCPDRLADAFEIAEKKAFRTTALFDRIAEDSRAAHMINSNLGSPKWIGRQYIIYLLGLSWENGVWNRSIIVNNFGLRRHHVWRYWTSHSLGLLEHRFWGSWTS